MKKHLALFLFALLATLSVFAGIKQDITRLVKQWNELHNHRDDSQLKNLYAGRVLFYGRTANTEDCYRRKLAFLNNVSNQQITSPVQLRYYASGTIQAGFTKRVHYGQTLKEYEGYLLFQKEGGRFRITGESDRQTDAGSGVTPALGKEVTEEEFEGKTNYLLFIALGVAVLLLLALLLYQRRGRKTPTDNQPLSPPPPFVPETLPAPESEPEATVQPEDSIEPQPEPPMVVPPPPAVPAPPLPISNPAEDRAKGHAFECYVVERFTPDYFTLLEWRSDKYHEGPGLSPVRTFWRWI